MKKQDFIAYISVFIFALLALTLIGLSFINDDDSSNENNTDETVEEIEEDFLVRSDIQSLPIEDTKNIFIGSKTVVLPQDFEVNAVLEIAENYPDYECKDGSSKIGCKLYFVTNGEIVYIISTPGAVLDTDTIGEIFSGSTILNGENIPINNEIVDISELDDLSELDSQNEEERTVLVRQSYGCLADNICVSSGIMDILNEENTLSDFNNFVNNLEINGE